MLVRRFRAGQVRDLIRKDLEADERGGAERVADRHINHVAPRAMSARPIRGMLLRRIGMSIPARYCTGYFGNIGAPPPYGLMDFAGWFAGFFWLVHGTPSMRLHQLPKASR